MPSSSNEHKLGITKWTWTLFAAVVGAGIVWVLLQASFTWDWSLPRFPLLASIVFLGLAILFLVFIVLTRKRLPLQPERGVPLLAIGKSCVIAGAGLFGGYLSLALNNIRFDAVIPIETFTSSCVAAISATLLIITGYIIQNACRLPHSEQ